MLCASGMEFALRQYVSLYGMVVIRCPWQIVPGGCGLIVLFMFHPLWFDGTFLLDDSHSIS